MRSLILAFFICPMFASAPILIDNGDTTVQIQLDDYIVENASRDHTVFHIHYKSAKRPGFTLKTEKHLEQISLEDVICEKAEPEMIDACVPMAMISTESGYELHFVKSATHFSIAFPTFPSFVRDEALEKLIDEIAHAVRFIDLSEIGC